MAAKSNQQSSGAAGAADARTGVYAPGGHGRGPSPSPRGQCIPIREKDVTGTGHEAAVGPTTAAERRQRVGLVALPSQGWSAVCTTAPGNAGVQKAQPVAAQDRHQPDLTVLVTKGWGAMAKHTKPGGGKAAAAAPWLQRWWKRLIAAATAVGVLLGAVTGVRALWPSPPPVRTAMFGAHSERYPISLTEYQQTGEGAPSRDVALRANVVRIQVAPNPGSTSASDPSLPAVTASTSAAPTTSPTEPSSSETSPSIGKTSDTSTDTPDSGRTTATTSAGTPVGVPATQRALTPKERSFVFRQVLPRAAELDPQLVLPNVRASKPARREEWLAYAQNAMVSADSASLSARKAAQRLVDLLEDARSTDTGDGRRTPVGIVADANIELEGLRGTPVFLRWSILDRDGHSHMFGDWLRRFVACRLFAKKDRESRYVSLWVPLPKQPGSYVLKLDLVTLTPEEVPMTFLSAPFTLRAESPR